MYKRQMKAEADPQIRTVLTETHTYAAGGQMKPQPQAVGTDD